MIDILERQKSPLESGGNFGNRNTEENTAYQISFPLVSRSICLDDMTASPCGRAAISDSGYALIWVALPTEKRRPHIMGYYVILQKKNRHCVELCFFPKLQISRIRSLQLCALNENQDH